MPGWIQMSCLLDQLTLKQKREAKCFSLAVTPKDVQRIGLVKN